MPLFDEIARKREALLEIAARHGASNLRLFGSVLRGEERPDSDVDILIDIEEDRGFDSYLALAEELELSWGGGSISSQSGASVRFFGLSSRPRRGLCEGGCSLSCTYRG